MFEALSKTSPTKTENSRKLYNIEQIARTHHRKTYENPKKENPPREHPFSSFFTKPQKKKKKKKLTLPPNETPDFFLRSPSEPSLFQRSIFQACESLSSALLSMAAALTGALPDGGESGFWVFGMGGKGREDGKGVCVLFSFFFFFFTFL